MNLAGERLTAIAGPKSNGLPFHDMDWDRALSLAENLTRFPGGQNAISFLGAGLMARCLFSPSERRALARHLVLPSADLLSRLVFRIMGAKNTLGRFSAASFVPALLTYAERPMKISVLHSDPAKAKRLRARLQRHAPWHDVIIATAETQDRCDLMVAIGRHARGRAMSQGIKANLTIFADIDLLRLGE